MGSGGSREQRESKSIETPPKDSIKEIKVKSRLRLQSIIAITLVGVISAVILVYFGVAMYLLKSSAEHTDNISKIGEQVLGKLLPILTLIIGYAFGVRTEEGE